MDRTKFYIIATVDGVQELDHLYNNLSGFTMNLAPQYYMVTEDDLMRVDLISFKSYGTVRYWWLIAFVNKIQDPFNDLTPGQILEIPNILDIYDFYKEFALR